MDKVKIKNVKTGAIEEVKKEIAGDFIGTTEWILVGDKESKETKEDKKFSFNKEEK